MDERSASILCIGPSHKTASLAARERFALVGAAAVAFTQELHAHPDVLEVVRLDTCNRNEIYLAATDVSAASRAAIAAFARHAQVTPADLDTLLEVRVADDAVQHLFRVAAGIESVVIGEPQIQGQIKLALDHAREARTCGPILHRMFQGALAAGKEVRTDTAIGSGSASVGSVGAKLLDQHLGSLSRARVLVIGAGRMGELAVRSIAEQGAAHIVVANRSLARAAHIAEQCHVEVVSMERLDDELALCDAVVSATNAPHVVVTRSRVAQARTDHRPLVLLDLAVPRDIDPAIAEQCGCTLFDLDDLERVVAETLGKRQREVEQAETIVSRAVAAFQRWHREQEAVPVIVELRQAADSIREEEMARFVRRASHLAPEDRRRVEQLTRSIVNRLLHAPTEHLRSRVSPTTEHASELGEGVADHELEDPWSRAVAQLLAADQRVLAGDHEASTAESGA
jgi:glutamyl-tRNA reductase